VAIASYHDFTETFYSASAITKILESLREGGKADIAKMAIKTTKPSQVAEMDYAINKFSEAFKLPAIGLCMGPTGAISRVTNNFLSFSTHPLMPGASAPGQLVSTEVDIPNTLKLYSKPCVLLPRGQLVPTDFNFVPITKHRTMHSSGLFSEQLRVKSPIPNPRFPMTKPQTANSRSSACASTSATTLNPKP
jgi:hypothetical protein